MLSLPINFFWTKNSLSSSGMSRRLFRCTFISRFNVSWKRLFRKYPLELIENSWLDPKTKMGILPYGIWHMWPVSHGWVKLYWNWLGQIGGEGILKTGEMLGRIGRCRLLPGVRLVNFGERETSTGHAAVVGASWSTSRHLSWVRAQCCWQDLTNQSSKGYPEHYCSWISCDCGHQ